MSRRQTDRKGRDLSSPESLRVFIGLAVQPFVVALTAFVTFPALDYTASVAYGGHSGNLWDGAESIALAVGIVGVGITLLGAVPLVATQLARGPLSRSQVLTSGLALGNIPTMLMCVLLIGRQAQSPGPVDLMDGPVGLARVLIFGSLFGLVGAATFWWIAGASVGPVSTEPRRSYESSR